jgi:hypothetical protein
VPDLAPDHTAPAPPAAAVPSLVFAPGHIASTTSAAPESSSALVPGAAPMQTVPQHDYLPQSSSVVAPRSSTPPGLNPAPAPPRTRSQARVTKPKIFSDCTVCYAYTATSGEPYTVKEALSSLSWKAAMIDECNALLRNKTWHLVPPVFGRNMIYCKWVYKLKYKVDRCNTLIFIRI